MGISESLLLAGAVYAVFCMTILIMLLVEADISVMANSVEVLLTFIGCLALSVIPGVNVVLLVIHVTQGVRKTRWQKRLSDLSK